MLVISGQVQEVLLKNVCFYDRVQESACVFDQLKNAVICCWPRVQHVAPNKKRVGGGVGCCVGGRRPRFSTNKNLGKNDGVHAYSLE